MTLKQQALARQLKETQASEYQLENELAEISEGIEKLRARITGTRARGMADYEKARRNLLREVRSIMRGAAKDAGLRR